MVVLIDGVDGRHLTSAADVHSVGKCTSATASPSHPSSAHPGECVLEQPCTLQTSPAAHRPHPLTAPLISEWIPPLDLIFTHKNSFSTAIYS